MGYLISETTKEEREKIAADSFGNIAASCDGCMAEMYQDYIEGKKEMRQINMEFSARYIEGGERPDRTGCSYQKIGTIARLYKEGRDHIWDTGYRRFREILQKWMTWKQS